MMSYGSCFVPGFQINAWKERFSFAKVRLDTILSDSSPTVTSLGTGL